MNNFAAVAEHFRKLRCAFCQQSFTPEGLKLLREEKDYWVVRVTCQACHQPSGVAVVGVDFDNGPAPAPAKDKPAARRIDGIFASVSEEKRFAELAPINKDEVLDAASFIRNLGSDWMRHLPRKKK
ncbi:MAG: hypothetical protein JWM80_3095 [Cyanobacteria bacterium RYN_339]|nr:hypothetical protein [Cyanobacteria bacterium RYN_339]